MGSCPANGHGRARLRFGPYELDFGAYRLTKFGVPVHLQPQVLRVLMMLVENRGALVSRQQLQSELWPSDTFVDFDHGVNKAINKLREALCDPAETAKYIETVPKQGYRFVGVVETIAPEEHRPVEQLAAQLTTPSPRARFGWPLAPLVWVGALVVLLLAAASWTLRPRPIPFAQRDWVLVADFTNRTGDAELDGIPSRMMRDLLAESQHVNVAIGPRVQDTLLLMRRPQNDDLDLASAREVAQRDGGIRLVIGGEVEKIGGSYRVAAQVFDPTSGHLLRGFQESAVNKEDVVPSLARLAGRLRTALGERVNEPSQRESLRRATTRSLKALRLYSQGMQKVDEMDWPGAIPPLQAAVEEDPEFASAHIYLAHSLANVGEAKRAGTHFEEAFRLAATVPDGERLFIVGSYYHRHQRDAGKAVQAYEALLALHPDHFWALNNIMGLRDHAPTSIDRLAEIAMQLARQRPNNLRYNERAMNYLIAADRREEALEWEKRARKLVALPESVTRYPAEAVAVSLQPVWRLQEEGKTEAALKEVERLVAESQRQGARYREMLSWFAAETFNEAGKLHAALAVLEHTEDPRADQFRGELALLREKPVEAGKYYRRAAKQREGFVVTIGLARSGDARLARKLANEQAKRLAPGSTRHTMMAEVLRAEGRWRVAEAEYLQAREAIRRVGGKYEAWNIGRAFPALAKMQEQRGERAAAIGTLEEAVGWNEPRNADFRVALPLARLYLKDGRPERAEQLLAPIRYRLAQGDADHPWVRELNRLTQEIAAAKQQPGQQRVSVALR